MFKVLASNSKNNNVETLFYDLRDQFLSDILNERATIQSASDIYRLYSSGSITRKRKTCSDNNIEAFKALSEHINHLNTNLNKVSSNKLNNTKPFTISSQISRYTLRDEHIQTSLDSAIDKSTNLKSRLRGKPSYNGMTLEQFGQDFFHITPIKSKYSNRGYRFYFNVKPEFLSEVLKGMLPRLINKAQGDFRDFKFSGPDSISRRDSCLLFTNPLSDDRKKEVVSIIKQYAHCFEDDLCPLTLPILPGVFFAKQEGLKASSFGMDRCTAIYNALNDCPSTEDLESFKEKVKGQFDLNGISFEKPYRPQRAVSMGHKTVLESQNIFFSEEEI
jgi:hypothetical protein